MELSAALFGAVVILLVVVLAVVYLSARVRTGRAPDQAEEHAHSGPDMTGDYDPIPEESGSGMPMVPPGEAGEQSVEEMQERARREAG